MRHRRELTVLSPVRHRPMARYIVAEGLTGFGGTGLAFGGVLRDNRTYLVSTNTLYHRADFVQTPLAPPRCS
jgi:hypothetical protein